MINQDAALLYGGNHASVGALRAFRPLSACATRKATTDYSVHRTCQIGDARETALFFSAIWCLIRINVNSNRELRLERCQDK